MKIYPCINVYKQSKIVTMNGEVTWWWMTLYCGTYAVDGTPITRKDEIDLYPSYRSWSFIL